MRRVALDTTFAGVNPTGVGRYSRQLAAALQALVRRPAGTGWRIAAFGPAAHALPPGAPSRLRQIRD
ncbi:MAG TPA: hypothetical protein VKY74_07530, partial [Chloroflexia bacterium]|nr:hypothetical protein [Chloroflexia bacterium]